jgi:hypothetical protein
MNPNRIVLADPRDNVLVILDLDKGAEFLNVVFGHDVVAHNFQSLRSQRAERLVNPN